MKIKVVFFGAALASTGQKEIELDLDRELSVNNLLKYLRERYPDLEKRTNSKTTVVSLNEGLADGSEIVKNGDEIMLLSVFAGG